MIIGRIKAMLERSEGGSPAFPPTTLFGEQWLLRLVVDWFDGHGSIYPFEHLRRSCPCGACADLAAPGAEATWPRELKKLDDALRIVWTDAHESLLPWVDLRAACRCASCTGAH